MLGQKRKKEIDEKLENDFKRLSISKENENKVSPLKNNQQIKKQGYSRQRVDMEGNALLIDKKTVVNH
jgi:hypothetical protein